MNCYLLIGAKEGVGTSTLCVNLALALRREGSRSVLLIGADARQPGDLAYLLGVDALPSLAQVVTHRTHLHGAGWRGYLAVAHRAIGGLVWDRSEVAPDVMDALCTAYDTIVIDGGAALPTEPAPWWSRVTHWGCVLTPDPMALRATGRLSAAWDAAFIPRDRVVWWCNQWTGDGLMPMETLATLPTAARWTLPLAPEVIDAAHRGLPPLLQGNRSPFAVALVNAARAWSRLPPWVTRGTGQAPSTGKTLPTPRQHAEVVAALQAELVTQLQERIDVAALMRQTTTAAALRAAVEKEALQALAELPTERLAVLGAGPVRASCPPAEPLEGAPRAPQPRSVDRPHSGREGEAPAALPLEGAPRAPLAVDRPHSGREGEALAALPLEGAPRAPLMNQAVLVRSVVDDLVGYGPLESLLNDDQVSEIMVNGPARLYCERAGRIESTPLCFRDGAHLRQVIDRMLLPTGRRVDELSPIVDARFGDRGRVNIVLPPLAAQGPIVTIRRFAPQPWTLARLCAEGMFTAAQAAWFATQVAARKNILVTGGTGSGKTTLLGALSAAIAPHERVITIEDAAELQLQQPHVVTLEARPPNLEGSGEVTIRDLVRSALRMRPDRIVVGECRGGEALDMLQAMHTGHDGSMTTLHANSARDALARLVTLVCFAGADLPVPLIRELIAGAIHCVVHLMRGADGRRRVVAVHEIAGMKNERLELREVIAG